MTNATPVIIVNGGSSPTAISVKTAPTATVAGAPVVATLATPMTVGTPVGSGFISFSNMALAAGIGGLLQSVLLLDNSGNNNSGTTYALYLYKAQPATSPVNNTNWTPTATDQLKALDGGPVLLSIVTPTNIASNSMLQYGIAGLAQAYTITAGTTLYGVLINLTSAPTFANASDVQIYLTYLPDAV